MKKFIAELYDGIRTIIATVEAENAEEAKERIRSDFAYDYGYFPKDFSPVEIERGDTDFKER